MIAFTSIAQNANGSWQFQWTAVPSTLYRIVLFGRQLATNLAVGSYNYILANYPSYPPPLECVPVGQKALSEIYIPFILIQWYAVLGVTSYEVDQFFNSAWSRVGSIIENGTQPVYTFQSNPLPDEMAYSFQVFAIDNIGQDSPTRQFDTFIATTPTLIENKVEIVYNPGTLTISGQAA